MGKESFENTLAALEKAVANLEGEDLSLEDSLRCFEDGVRNLTVCQTYLKAAENKIELLLKKQNGSLRIESVPTEDE